MNTRVLPGKRIGERTTHAHVGVARQSCAQVFGLSVLRPHDGSKAPVRPALTGEKSEIFLDGVA